MPPSDWFQRALANATNTTVTSLSPKNISSPPNTALIIVYDTLYIVGIVSLFLVLVVLSWLSSKTRRKDLCFLTVFSWLVEAIAHLLIVGQQVGVKAPNENMCLIQAMAVYGSPAFAGLTCAGYMIQIYYTLLPMSAFHRYRIWTILLHVVPITVFIVIMVEVFIVGKVLYPDSIQRDPSGMYCNLDTQHGTLAVILSDGFAILSLAIIMIFEELDYPNYLALTFRQIRRIPRDSAASASMLANAKLVRDILKRVMVFSLWAGMCFGVYILYCIPSANGINAEIQVVWATLPCVAALVFGMQKDIMRVSKFWKKRESGGDVV